MLNNIIFTVKKPDQAATSTTVQDLHYMAGSNCIINILDSGSILLQSLKSSQIHDVVLLKPDFMSPKLGIVCWTILLSPFNVFKQNGKWSIIALYEDGRLRFWDLTHHKCYLISKHNDIKAPKGLKSMGALLQSRKRFIYMLSMLKSPTKDITAV